MHLGDHVDIMLALVSCHSRTLVQAEDLIVVYPA